MRATIKPNELARLSGYTSQRIRQLQADGVLPHSVARGKLPREEAIAALFAHLRGKLPEKSESRSANQNREQSAKATLAEIAIHEKLGNLSPTSWLRESVCDLAVTIRECVMTTPGVPEEIRRRVQQTLHDMELHKRASIFARLARIAAAKSSMTWIDSMKLWRNPMKKKAAESQRQNKAGD